jgi:cyclic pyranopterin phosphate synthase
VDKLTHTDESGKARMADVGGKKETRRTAKATARVTTRPDVIDLIRRNEVQKGDVLGVARTAGIMAAKNTAGLIPLCHPIPIDSIQVEFKLEVDAIIITTMTHTSARTGVEMEALTAASIAALTIYDMCKAVDKGMTIEHLRLLEKTGGKSGDFMRDG